jgi:tRNA (mo5U34)-methyltransferase
MPPWMAPPLTPEAARDANPVWYHSIDLGPGVATTGATDFRHVAPRVLGDLRGVRALDVGTFDGFWAFAMEDAGADVVAIDLEHFSQTQLPPLRRAALEARAAAWGVELGRGFRLAAEARGSRVLRVPCDVMALDAERIGGPADLALVGALLLHQRDPVGALERVRGALRPGGRLLLVEWCSVAATLRFPRRPVADFQADRTDFNWWTPNLAALHAWARAAGFRGPRLRRLVRSRGRDRHQAGPYAVIEARA